ncbi:MAG: ferritin-like domain-containing protein [Acutalibacteraceae bacterium]|jgi:rubrerythrin|nr:ferritin-like domain-containing protein [Acutalibacteraceae bacterium]
MQLTQKETSLLKDLKGQEKLCVEKYTKYASSALDPQLKELFTSIANVEQQHLNTISQIESGSMPQANSGSSQTVKTSFTSNYGMGDTPDKQADCYLCSDLLADEKHVSGLYNTCIFEFNDKQLRDTLNHIQKEEQEHGKAIYDYMSANNMYS